MRRFSSHAAGCGGLGQVMAIVIVAFFGATLLGTALVLIKGEPEKPCARRSPAVWVLLLVVTLLAGTGAAWEEASLRRFARHEGVELRGLIMKPVPLTPDHQFTKNGREYLREGIQLPALITCSTLLLVAFAGTVLLHVRDLRGMVPAVWLHTITAIGAIVLFSILRFLASIDFFI
jgi:hypothetical protein